MAIFGHIVSRILPSPIDLPTYLPIPSNGENYIREVCISRVVPLHSGRWCRHNLATVCDGKFWRHLVMPVQPHIYLLIPCCFIFRYVVVMYSLLLFDVLRYFCVKLLINSTITVVVSRFLC